MKIKLLIKRKDRQNLEISNKIRGHTIKGKPQLILLSEMVQNVGSNSGNASFVENLILRLIK
jgi:hypothetical protein